MLVKSILKYTYRYKYNLFAAAKEFVYLKIETCEKLSENVQIRVVNISWY